ncbi:MAG TPA: hypothetical protein VML75_02100 [Kofleriaceae bacterium]|nr:hypothetical protein [Kofleriaceae bacterium]
MLALIALLAGSAHAEPTSYGREPRVAYLERALGVLEAMAPSEVTALEDALQAGARNQCKASYGQPPVSCLVQVARTYCEARPVAERAACHLVADLALTNQLGESELVDERTRIKLMNASGGFRAAMRAELRARYAGLTAEMTLTATGSTPAARVDEFCSGTRRTLTWQRCAAAIIWYIGTHRGDPS